jgi:hypothetical protein
MWPWGLIYHHGLLKPLVRLEEPLYGEVERKQMEGTVSSLGPKCVELGSLGALRIANLKSLGYALRTRWSWLKKIEPNKPWAYLPLKVFRN